MELTAAMVGAILAFAGLSQADRTVKFVNHCPYDLYYWAVGPYGSNMPGIDYQGITVPAYGNSTHGMVNTEGWGGGVVLKIRDLPYFQTAPAGIMQVEYFLQPSNAFVWYDLSRIDCSPTPDPMDPYFCPLIAGGMKLSVVDQDPTPDCPHAVCTTNGTCHNVYTKHGTWEGEPSFHCHLNIDIEVETCTEGAGPKTFDHRAPKLEDDQSIEPTRSAMSTPPTYAESVPTEIEYLTRTIVLTRSDEPVEPTTVYTTILESTTVWTTLMKTTTVHHTNEMPTPVYSGPVEITPVYSVPAHLVPVSSAPTKSTPEVAAPGYATPPERSTVYSRHTEFTLIYSMPMKSKPVEYIHQESSSVYSTTSELTSVYSMPANSSPIYAPPIEPTIVYSPPAQTTPAYNIPGYSTPSTSTPAYSALIYSAPVESTQVYLPPSGLSSVYSPPVETTTAYSRPAYSVPNYFPPAYSSPAYSSPAYSSPAYSAPVESSPVYSSKMYSAPAELSTFYSPPPAEFTPVYSAPVNPLIVSPDGSCGGPTGYTCKGNALGQCCSEWGFCGASKDYCNAKSQLGFGLREHDYATPDYTAPISVSPHGLCGEKVGFTCKNSSFGHCCSKWGFCGGSGEYCSTGCQDAFGTCHGMYDRDAAPELIKIWPQKLSITKVVRRSHAPTDTAATQVLL